MKKLRLLLLKECNRNCAGCCNKDWDLDSLPVPETYKGYDEIYLTGGEPTLRPSLILEVVRHIREQNSKAKIYLYSANFDLIPFQLAWPLVDGFTMTIHEQEDVHDFEQLDSIINEENDKSLRLNIFDGITMGDVSTDKWIVKDGIEWIKDCPLPQDEVFMKWNTPH
jgi:hypothetical protein